MAFNDANSLLVLAKLQTAEGSPATPTVAADEVWVSNPNPIQSNTAFTDDSFLSTDHTPQVQSRGRRKNNVTIETKLMARGDNSGVPSLDPLLQAAGMGVPTTGTEETSKDFWDYAPVSGTSKLASIWSYEDGILKKATDCRGTFVLAMNAGATPNLTFTYAGKYVAPTSVATPTPTMPADTKTIVENSGLLIDTFSPTWSTFTLTHGNQLEEILDGNSDKAYHSEKIAGRSGARIALTIRAQNTLTNKDFFSYIESQGEGGVYDDISLTHGDGVQSDIVITCTDPQLIQDPDVNVANGIRTYNLTYLLRTYTLKFREEQ